MENGKKVSQFDKIIDASYKCLSERGYANVSLREIANEAGVALSQLHYYFGSKKELFKAIMEKNSNEYLQKVEYHLKNTEKPIDRIKFFQESVINDPAATRLLWDFTSLALWSDSFRDVLNKLYDDLAKIIEEYILDDNSVADRIKEYDPKLFSRMILGSMLGVGVQVLIDPDGERLLGCLDPLNTIFK
ncbi:TetR/AcrR family transcriptional regulator [Wukongibacter baidiensis]|uniref:TetR/AcrR family transcriptional regulator n=1 Tax=Wukongibacter baidiensis TaxID=1723361 RepID=UPI003D7FC19B